MLSPLVSATRFSYAMAACSSESPRNAARSAKAARNVSATRSTAASGSPVVALLVQAAELHARADLEVVDAAERDLGPDILATLQVPVSSAAAPRTRANPA